MIKFEFEGKEYRFAGEYRQPKPGDTFLSKNVYGVPLVSTCALSTLMQDGFERAIVEGVRPRIEVDGLVFEETGEVRRPKLNEWYAFAPGVGGIGRFEGPGHVTNNNMRILRRVVE